MYRLGSTPPPILRTSLRRLVCRRCHVHTQSLPISKLDSSGITLLQQRLSQTMVAPQLQFKYPQGTPDEAAVLLLLCTVNGQVSVLFEERNRRLSSHSGEICFAGGKADPRDLSLDHTAVREAEEELGIDSRDVQIIGRLLPVPSKDYRLRVHPFVGVLADHVDVKKLKVNGDEVHRAFTLPLDHFYDPAKRSTMRFRNTGLSIPVYQSDKQGLAIWGLTAFILHEFLRCIQ